jgi:purine-binding chemotaxis protein CheW
MKNKNKIENSLERLFSAKKSDLEKTKEETNETIPSAPAVETNTPTTVKIEPIKKPAAKPKKTVNQSEKPPIVKQPGKQEKMPEPQPPVTEKNTPLESKLNIQTELPDHKETAKMNPDEKSIKSIDESVDAPITKAIVAKKEEQRYNADEHLVIFSLANQSYGISIMIVESIIKMQAITFVPRAHPSIEGATNLRGVVLPVINLCKKLGLPISDDNQNRRIVVVAIQDVIAGFIVDNVQSVLRIPASEIAPPSPMVTSINTKYIKGIAKNGDQGLVIILDPVKIFESIIMETSDKNQIHLLK